MPDIRQDRLLQSIDLVGGARLAHELGGARDEENTSHIVAEIGKVVNGQPISDVFCALAMHVYSLRETLLRINHDEPFPEEAVCMFAKAMAIGTPRFDVPH